MELLKEKVAKKEEQIVVRLSSDLASEVEELSRYDSVSKSAELRRLLTVAVKHTRLERGIQAFINREASLSKAAEIAKMGVWDFMDELSRRGISFSRIGVGELEATTKTKDRVVRGS
jgi:predicted HTH domain antitoxin